MEILIQSNNRHVLPDASSHTTAHQLQKKKKRKNEVHPNNHFLPGRRETLPPSLCCCSPFRPSHAEACHSPARPTAIVPSTFTRSTRPQRSTNERSGSEEIWASHIVTLTGRQPSAASGRRRMRAAEAQAHFARRWVGGQVCGHSEM